MREHFSSSTSDNLPSSGLLRCIQINLRHSSLASASLAQVVLDLNIDIVLIQEPFALPACPPVLANVPPGFSSFHLLSEDHAYGSAILVRDTVATAGKIACKHISNFAACVELATCSGPLRMVSVYIRPSTLNFTTTFSPILDAVASPFVVIGSDVNAKSLLWNSRCSDKRGVELETLLDSSNLNVANRPLAELDFTPGETSFVDLTLVGDQVKIVRWLFLAIPSLSDHPYIFFEIAHSDFVVPKRRPNRLKVPSVANINTDLFSSKLVKSLSRLPSPTGTDSAEVIEAHISGLVSVLSSSAFAARIPKPRCPPVKSMPWWSQELCALRSKVRSLHKVWSRNKNLHTDLAYRRSKALYQRSLRAAKCKAWESVRKSATNGDVFRAFSDFTGKSKSIPLPSEVCINGSLTSDPMVIADGCARHFFPDEPLSDSSHSDIEAAAQAALSSSPLDHPPLISDWEFEAAAGSLNSKSAPGNDGLPADLLLFSLPLIKPFLIAILNACLYHCFFPDCWKIVKITVIGKPNKDDYSTLSSFRPISLISNLAKFLEKVMLGRLLWFASANKWLCTSQHGFRENRSTETAAHSLVSFIESAFSEKKVCATAFLDIKSAFDSAWHPAILAALAGRGCPSYLLKTVNSFLSNRQACFVINDHTLKRRVNLGCPQGGVLSPFLWNVLIDDLLRTSFPFPVKMFGYADDIVVATTHKDPVIATQHLQLACNTVGNWLAMRKLFLNAIKTVFVLFSRKTIPLNNLSVVINSVKIYPSLSATFLGLIFDANLKWANHVQSKCASAKRAMMAVSSCLRLAFGFDALRLRFLYSTTVEPIFTYGCSIWASFLRTKAGVKKIRSFQRSICRMITSSLKTVPTESLLVLSNLIPLDLKILEIATLRLLATPMDECFCNSSRSFILKRVPFGQINHSWTKARLPNLSDHPPWCVSLYVTSLSSLVIPLCPEAAGTLRCYVSVHHQRKTAGFCVVLADSIGVLKVLNWSLPPDISLRTGFGLAFSEALSIICKYRASHSSCEIFVADKQIYIQPASPLDPTEIGNLAILASLGSYCHVFTDTGPGSPGLSLASVWANSPAPFLTVSVNSSPCHIKRSVRSHVSRVWNNEWVTSPGNLSVKAVFPDVCSAKVLLTRRTNAVTTQLFTGHCLLNAHQYRFGFASSASCACGAPFESIPHFLFHCPTYSSFRTSLVEVATSFGTTWPPDSLQRLCQYNHLWNSVLKFVLRTKRLARGKSAIRST